MSFLERLRLATAHELQPRTAPPADPAELQSGNYDGDILPNAGRAPVPLGTMAQNPRVWDYAYTSNSQYVPRAEIATIPSFVHLMTYALLSDYFRVASSYVWEEVNAVPVDVVYKKGSRKPKSLERQNWVENMVEYPDPLSGWDRMQWTRVLGTSADAIDATAIYPVKNYAGEVIAQQHVDGTTIKPLIGQKGYAPLLPYAAYEQFIHGVPYAKFSRDELLYYPFNPRNWCPYGASPLEEMLNIVARLYLQGKWEQMKFTEGNIPQAVALMDSAQNILGGKAGEQQMLGFQKALDAISGMTAKRRRLYLLPKFIRDLKPVNADTKFDRELPEWEVKWLCVRMGIPPHLFISQSNRATAKEHGEQLVNGKHRMRLMAVERVWDRLLAMMGADEYRVVYRRPRNFSMEQVQGIQMLAGTPTVRDDGTPGPPLMTIDEARSELGFEDDRDAMSLETEDLNDRAERIETVTDAEIVGEDRPQPAAQPALPAPQPQQVTKAGGAHTPSPKVVGLQIRRVQGPIVHRFAKSLKDTLEAKRQKALAEASKAARARGVKVTK